MSLAIQRAKYRGDSFLGDIGKIALPIFGGIVGGPAGAALGGALANKIGGAPAPTQTKTVAEAKLAPQGPGSGIGGQIRLPKITGPGGISIDMGGGGIGMGAGGGGPFFGAPNGTVVETAQGMQMVCGTGLKGTHLNKSTYITRAGIVPKGTKCVSNRRMNPLNPRALSHAMRRITSAKSAASVLGRITIRKASCGRCK